MQNISIEAAKAKGFISGYRVGRIILACSIERWKYGKLLKELREDCTNIFKFHTGRRTRYYYDPFEVLEKIKGYKQYGNRHLSKEKIDEKKYSKLKYFKIIYKNLCDLWFEKLNYL